MKNNGKYKWSPVKFKKLLEERGLTVTALSRELRLPRQHIYVWINGGQPLAAGFAELLDILQVSYKELLEEGREETIENRRN